MGKIEFIPDVDYVSYRHLIAFQDVVADLFSNFDGGFGMFRDDEYQLHKAVPTTDFRNIISFSFVTSKPTPDDVARYTWPPNDYKNGLESFVEYKQAFVLVCNHYNIKPVLNGTTMNELVNKHKIHTSSETPPSNI